MGSTLEGRSSIKGGLPVWVRIRYGKDVDTPNGPGEYWAAVESISFLKRDGAPGTEISQRLWDEGEAYDPYWCALIEEAETRHMMAKDAGGRDDG